MLDNERVQILRKALQKARSGLDAAACYFDNQDNPSVVLQVEEALQEAKAALEATKAEDITRVDGIEIGNRFYAHTVKERAK